MGFLKRINSVLDKNAHNKNEYQINALKRLNLAKNEFKTDFIFQDKNSPEYLALNNPVQFIYKYLNSQTIDRAIKLNPEVSRIVENNNLSTCYEIDNVSSIIASHLVPTARMAHVMYYNINSNPDVDNYISLIQAALLHDIGKVFIPKSILNKTGKLSLKERIIVELHNRLSYEILKTTNLKPQVARLAWEHHNYDSCFTRTPENQALMIADIYCALREARPYKKALSDIAARIMLYDMGASGKFDVSYIRYLCA